eukprot:TRINITY_DN29556_c0_g1_i1.p2 TRINITY_DN29556_c0_g1~~TRINITY_DN29556_c0_g1_i1.p2  ORF type:complete len:103 (-),score=22.29 TRINITY_DN29556_c0_g1_i1:16-324(-)
MMLGPAHGVCKKGFYVAIISTTKEKDNMEEDLKVAFELVGDIKYKFSFEEVKYAAKNYDDNIFVTSSLDETSHFESSANDVMKVYEAMTGKTLDLNVEEKKE